MKNGPIEKSVVDRFWSKVDKSGDCWIWQGKTNEGGYGVFDLPGWARTAHRASVVLSVGFIPKGLMVCHRCDVRNCVRPDHLYAGTAADNGRDRSAKTKREYEAMCAIASRERSLGNFLSNEETKELVGKAKSLWIQCNPNDPYIK